MLKNVLKINIYNYTFCKSGNHYVQVIKTNHFNLDVNFVIMEKATISYVIDQLQARYKAGKLIESAEGE